MEYKSMYKSKIGNIILRSDGKYLTGLFFETSRFLNLREIKNVELNEELKVFKLTKSWLDKYFNNEHPNIDILPLKLIGTSFSMKVWDILKKVPYGECITYGQIAKELESIYGKRVSAQAVGHAVGYNPISIIIPCHRVIGVKGNLTGYSGGLDVKLKLLEHEKVDTKKFFKP